MVGGARACLEHPSTKGLGLQYENLAGDINIQTIAPFIPAPLQYPCHTKHGGRGPCDVLHSVKGVPGRETLRVNVS